VRNHIPKRVPECLMLGNHSIIVNIFSPIDFKKRLRRDTDERFHLSTAQDRALLEDEKKFMLGGCVGAHKTLISCTNMSSKFIK
jgi:hypothetical protein